MIKEPSGVRAEGSGEHVEEEIGASIADAESHEQGVAEMDEMVGCEDCGRLCFMNETPLKTTMEVNREKFVCTIGKRRQEMKGSLERKLAGIHATQATIQAGQKEVLSGARETMAGLKRKVMEMEIGSDRLRRAEAESNFRITSGDSRHGQIASN